MVFDQVEYFLQHNGYILHLLENKLCLHNIHTDCTLFYAGQTPVVREMYSSHSENSIVRVS